MNEKDLWIREDAAFTADTRCEGTIIIEKGATLTTSRYAVLSAPNMIVRGTLQIAGEGEGFKPGHVFGKEADNPLAVQIAGEIRLEGGTIIGPEAVATAASAVIAGEVKLTGMFGFSKTTMEEASCLVTRGGTWIMAEEMEIKKGASFDLSETEICVLRMRKDPEGAKGGFYDHEGYGNTIVGDHVSVKGDDTFIWLWFGRVEGAFETIRGNIVLKTCGGNYSDAEDMANIETSPLAGSGTEDDPFTFTWHEIDPDYVYHNPRQLAIDAVVNNALQERLPGALIFDFNKELFAFTEKHFRAGNVLIHELYFDPPTIRALADYRALARQV